MFRKFTQADIDLALSNGKLGKPVLDFEMIPNLNGRESAVAIFIPPGVEALVPLEHVETVKRLRVEFTTALTQSLDDDDYASGGQKNMERINLAAAPYLAELIKLVPDYLQLGQCTDFMKESRENFAYNIEFTKKFKGKYIRMCNNVSCGRKGLWKRCSGCKKIHYCSTNCQKADWDTHKVECTKDWK